jgi:hypothetical protein
MEQGVSHPAHDPETAVPSTLFVVVSVFSAILILVVSVVVLATNWAEAEDPSKRVSPIHKAVRLTGLNQYIHAPLPARLMRIEDLVVVPDSDDWKGAEVTLESPFADRPFVLRKEGDSQSLPFWLKPGSYTVRLRKDGQTLAKIPLNIAAPAPGQPARVTAVELPKTPEVQRLDTFDLTPRIPQ